MSDVLPHAPGRWPDALLPWRRRPRGAALQRARVLGLGGEPWGQNMGELWMVAKIQECYGSEFSHSFAEADVIFLGGSQFPQNHSNDISIIKFYILIALW